MCCAGLLTESNGVLRRDDGRSEWQAYQLYFAHCDEIRACCVHRQRVVMGMQTEATVLSTSPLFYNACTNITEFLPIPAHHQK